MAEGSALEMRYTGQPVRGFKSLHLRLTNQICLCIITTVVKTFTIHLNTGDWSNGMIGVSKTFGGSSILSSPAP